jgi:dTMP kinase
MSDGAFVVIEGGDASGKTTQALRLAEALRADGREVVETREPGGTDLGAHLRALLLDGADIDPVAELLLLLADRAQHVVEIVRPAIERGAVVVCDRFSPSSLAYQGVGRGIGVETVEALDALARGGTEPDVVVIVDVADDVAAARSAARPDRLERAGAEFHAQVRAAYRDLAPDRGWDVVDGSGDIDAVAAAVLAAVRARLGPTP